MFSDNRCMDFNKEMPRPEMKEYKHEEHMHHAHTMPAQMPAMDMGMNMNMGCCPQQGMVCPPVYECPQERCCHREIVHEVPHIQPVNTRIINHHIYRHTFSPCFSACEENVCSDVYENPCGCGRF